MSRWRAAMRSVYFYHWSLLAACLVEIGGGRICRSGEQYALYCLAVITFWVLTLAFCWRPNEPRSQP